MGRSKKRSRTSASRLNPLANPNSGGISKKDANLIERKLQPLIKNLNSVVPNERRMALSSATVLCEDAHMRKLLLKEKLIPTVTTKLLSDENTEIVVEAYGLLRNLCLEEGYDVAVHLWRSDIWTSILSGFEKLSDSLRALAAQDASEDTKKTTPQSKESRRLLFDFAENLLSLVIALCNGADSILEEVLTTQKLAELFTVLVNLLEYGIEKLPISVFNTILDLIYDFSSESFEFIETVSSDPTLSEFVKVLPTLKKEDHKSFNELTYVLIQGIYLQFLDMDMTYEQANEIIHTTCNAINGIDLVELEKNLSSITQDEDIANTVDSEVAAKIKEYTKKRALAHMQLQSIEITIDLITAIIEIIAAKFEQEHKRKLPESLSETLVSFVPLVFNKLASSFPARVLIGWNNLLWLYMSIDVNFYELPNNQHTLLWNFIKKEEGSDSKDISLKVSLMSVVWAMLKAATLQSEPLAVINQLGLNNSMAFVETIINEYKTCNEIELQQKCIGVLSSLALVQNQVEINRFIGHFFMEILTSKESDPLLLVEVTNFIFEIYSDSAYDYDTEVFVKDSFLQTLKEKVVPNLKERFKFVDRNKSPELKERATETFNILGSFINYKESEAH